MPKGQENGDDTIIIKKYANRRLYNTAVAEFVTLDDLHKMVTEGTNFAVKDAKTGNDITTSVLAQIVAEEESKGHNMLPLNYLRQLLSFYNDGMGQYMSTYLDQSMENFAENQQHIMQQMQDVFGGAGTGAMQQLNEISRRNMEIFQQSMSMFGGAAGDTPNGSMSNGKSNPGDQDAGRQEIETLQAQLAEIQKRLNELSSGS